MQRPDGSAGIGSGWLTHHALLNDEIALRIRTNASFHLPAGSPPLLLIANGTGIAGLRALLKERIGAGQRRNWLVFGERTLANDFFYRETSNAGKPQAHRAARSGLLPREQRNDATSRID